MLELAVISTKGRYCSVGGEDIPCLADVSSVDSIALQQLTSAPLPNAGVRIVCFLEHLGLIDGIVLYGRPGGFVFQVVANPERRSRIEAQLAWLRDIGDREDQRQAARIIPIYRDVRVDIAGDHVATALIADLSRTGAALMLDERPQVGTTVTVGKRFARVVRHTPDGVGVAFRLPFGPLTFNERVIL